MRRGAPTKPLNGQSMPVRLEPLSPHDAVQWLRARKLQASFDWKDLWRIAQESSFAIAGVTELDLLSDFQEAISVALEEGMAFEQFQDNAEKILRYHGWWGPAITEDPLTGKQRTVNLGNANRLRNIYRTNIGSALAASRFEHITETAADRIARGGGMTYLRYDAVGRSARTCETCASFDGMIRPFNDPIWSLGVSVIAFSVSMPVDDFIRKRPEAIRIQSLTETRDQG